MCLDHTVTLGRCEYLGVSEAGLVNIVIVRRSRGRPSKQQSLDFFMNLVGTSGSHRTRVFEDLGGLCPAVSRPVAGLQMPTNQDAVAW